MNKKGFTLVELLVSFILVIIVIVFFSKTIIIAVQKENKLLLLQEYTAFEATFLKAVNTELNELQDKTVTESGNTVYIGGKELGFITSGEKGITFDNIIYPLPSNTDFAPKSGKYYSVSRINSQNKVIINIPLKVNNQDKAINIVVGRIPQTVTKKSSTSNINESGVKTSDYANNLSTTDTVTINGASKLHVKLTYGTESNYDMVYVFKGVYSGDVTRNMSAGQLNTYMGEANVTKTVEFDVTGDTVTFAFYSDVSVAYYGYYAEVSANVAKRTKYSHTTNIDDDGVATGTYQNNLNTTDTVTINGAKKLNVEVWFSTESTTYDWLAIYPKGVTPSASNYSSATISGGKLGGGSSKTKPSDTNTSYHKTYTVDGDTVQFYFKSDVSVNYYGYYAIVTEDDTPVPKCKRATTLHENPKGGSFGQLGTSGTLTSGDAFDCDVNGDGTYDSATERFYYVSNYYDTSSKSFNSDVATLIYYTNVTGGTTADNTSVYAYYGVINACNNNSGPQKSSGYAYYQLPSISQWSNISLYKTSRQILTDTGATSTNAGTLPTNYSYSDKAARFLTAQEIKSACNITAESWSPGQLSTCTYLMENTWTFNSSYKSGYWLETPKDSSDDLVYGVYSNYYGLTDYRAHVASEFGIRPVIEVLKSDMSY